MIDINIIRTNRQLVEDNLKKIEAVLFATQIIEELPGIYSEVLYLHCVLELSEREIAQLLGISINAVRQRVHRGRKMFYNAMMKGEEANDRKKVWRTYGWSLERL